MYDRVMRRGVSNAGEFTLHRFRRRLCDICIFVHPTEPLVYVGGSEYGYDGLVREADVVEIEALAERYGLADLNVIAARRRDNPRAIDSAANPPAQ